MPFNFFRQLFIGEERFLRPHRITAEISLSRKLCICGSENVLYIQVHRFSRGDRAQFTYTCRTAATVASSSPTLFCRYVTAVAGANTKSFRLYVTHGKLNEYKRTRFSFVLVLYLFNLFFSSIETFRCFSFPWPHLIRQISFANTLIIRNSF